MSFSPGTYSEGRNLSIRFRSEVPDNSGADKNIVLPADARARIQLWYTRPEVSRFPAQAKTPDEPHIEPHTGPHYTRSGSGLARVCPSKLKRGTFTEMAESAPKTEPRTAARRTLMVEGAKFFCSSKNR